MCSKYKIKRISNLILSSALTIFLYIGVANSSYNFSSLRLPSIFNVLDEKGLAVDEDGRKTAIQHYQLAINRIIEWVKQHNGIDGLSEIKVIGLIGSFSRIEKELPRIGVYQNRDRDGALLLEITKDGPSDIDILLEIDESIGDNHLSAQREIDKEVSRIFEDLGVTVQIWTFNPALSPPLPISQVAGDGLLKIYDSLPQEAKKQAEITKAIRSGKYNAVYL